MAIQKTDIARFLQLALQYPVLDVRSPGEYMHAHIPGAISLPLFSDEERKVVGTAYKQQNKQTAIKIGLDYFGVKMRNMVETVEEMVAKNKLGLTEAELSDGNTILVNCWRGGMRSAGVAWLLDLYGFKVFTLSGGYKAYRNWVLKQFEKDYPLTILGGYTGSGKTLVLDALKKSGQPVIDLEKLASHKGSAFGALGELPQPSQEMFENLLAGELFLLTRSVTEQPENIFIEDESQRVGNKLIPNNLWKQLRNKSIFFIDVPFEERLDYITENYGQFEKEKLVNAIIRIQKRLGGLETKTAIGFLLENNTRECFRILLNYYDKLYSKGLKARENLNDLLTTIPCDKIEPIIIKNRLIHATKTVQ